ncbi:hypothetical protein EMIT0347P_30277 [Pseudomonas sp. IT-347P]
MKYAYVLAKKRAIVFVFDNMPNFSSHMPVANTFDRGRGTYSS